MKSFLTFILLILLISCKNQKTNYIVYYNKVLIADSIMRFENDTIKSLKKYRKVFKKFEPKNDDRLNEFENFIILSDYYNKNFGGKKSLLKLVKLNAYNWETKKNDKKIIHLFEKYKVDSSEINSLLKDCNKNLNKTLIDSFKIALKRDQEERPTNLKLVKKNVDKNARLLIWTFENYGFPSSDKIGWFPMLTFLTHMIESDKYPYFEKKLLEYVKSGECAPRDYAMMIDYNLLLVEKQNKTIYGFNGVEIIDSIQVNKNRKSIGLPGLIHNSKIRKDLKIKKSKQNLKNT